MELMPRVTASFFECMDVRVTHGSKFMRLLALYRPPPSTKSKFTESVFSVEFAYVLERFSTEAGNLLLTGDFNFHWDSADAAKASQFRNTLDSADLSQHVSELKHESGHILDLVITRVSEKMMKETVVSDLFSDHHVIHVRLKFSKPHQTGKRETFHKLCSINQQELHNDIVDSTLVKGSETSLNDVTECYDSVLRKLLVWHAPLRSRIFPIKDKVPWCTVTIMQR